MSSTAKDLTAAEPHNVAEFQPPDTARMMEIAIQQGEAGVAALERLVALKERADAEFARRQFFDALAAFQAECPIIERRKGIPDNSGVIKYRYAPLESIIQQVAGLLRAHGLSYRFDSEHQQGGVTVRCTLTHTGGHSETSEAFMPGVQVPKANAAQNAGAGITYGKRIAFLNATGILTADTDTDGDDGSGPGDPAEEVITEEQAATLKDLADEVQAKMPQFLKWMGVERIADIKASRYQKAVRGLEAKRSQPREGAQ